MASSGINKIGIIGAGRMGTDIFNFLIGFDYEIAWICLDETETVALQQSFEKKIKRLHKCGLIDDQQLITKLNSVVINHQVKSLDSCELVIECIWEDIAKKQQMYRGIIPVLTNDCILASNSSSFLPSQLIPAPAFNARFIGLHFFYPVKLKNIVELIKTGQTSAETIEKINGFCKTTNKKQLLQDEKHAFWLNRLFLEVQNEAFQIFDEGVMSYEQIDTIVAEYLFPEGIFKFFDQVGNDVMLQSIKNYTSGNRKTYQVMLDKLEELCSKNMLGLKTKAGFYSYHDESAVNATKSVHVKDEYYFMVLERLKRAYIGKAQQLINDGACDRETLEYAAKEYMNTDKGPFAIARALLNT
ncbi:MAG TPA: 3-hydroxyacyl-CoA dehydrogenase family protein [Bacteroidales bacterium]|nr:3-hydroxyacyl-CoA dehydrogenase family protein [Bacteroidales bacterium]